MNFLSPLLDNGVIFDDDTLPKHPVNKSDNIINSKNKNIPVKKFAEFFMDIALQSLELQKYKYSLQAMASIVAARRTLNIDPVWNPKLNITINASKFDEFKSFDYNDVMDCYTILFNKYERHFSKHQKPKAVNTKPKEKPNVAADIPKQRNRILSGTRICEVTRNKPLSKNASQPVFDKFMTKKASYMSYIKGSKVNSKKSLKSVKEIKNTINAHSILRMHSVTTMGALKKKRASVEVMSRHASKPVINRVQTPQCMIINNASKKSLVGKMTSESSQRGQSTNYRKLRVHRLGDRKRSHALPEHKFRTKKVDVSRNRSISVNHKIKNNSKLGSSKPLVHKVDKLVKYDTLQHTESQVLTMVFRLFNL
jgi:hypothetical protein